jgi:hypothetical protein
VAMLHPLPQWKATDALWVVATQLRQAVFVSQAAAARALKLNKTTISRYETYESGGAGLKPPFAYLATLAYLRGEQAANAETAAVQEALVTRLETIRKRFYSEESLPPLRMWTDLAGYAARYRGPPAAPPPAPPRLLDLLDAPVYSSLVWLMGGEAPRLLELLLGLGLLLAAWPCLRLVFALPPEVSDRASLLAGTVGIGLATTLLPLLVGGSILVLEVRRRPAWRHFRGRAALPLLLLAYGGASFGILTGLSGAGLATLLVHYLGLTHPALTPILRGGTLLATVGLGVVFSERFVRVLEQSTPDITRVRRGDVLMGGAAPLFSWAAAWLLLTFYDLLLDNSIGVVLLAAAVLIAVLWSLRGPRSET